MKVFALCYSYAWQPVLGRVKSYPLTLAPSWIMSFYPLVSKVPEKVEHNLQGTFSVRELGHGLIAPACQSSFRPSMADWNALCISISLLCTKAGIRLDDLRVVDAFLYLALKARDNMATTPAAPS